MNTFWKAISTNRKDEEVDYKIPREQWEKYFRDQFITRKIEEWREEGSEGERKIQG